MFAFLVFSYGVTTLSACIYWRQTTLFIKGKNKKTQINKENQLEQSSLVTVLQMGEYISKVQQFDKILEELQASTACEEKKSHIANPQDVIKMQEAVKHILCVLRPIFKQHQKPKYCKLKKAHNITMIFLTTIYCLPLLMCTLFWLSIQTIDVVVDKEENGKTNCVLPFTYYWVTTFVLFCLNAIQIWPLFSKVFLSYKKKAVE